MSKITTREQELVNICFSLVLTATDLDWIEVFKTLPNEEKADWVREQLRACGFNISEKVGCSWGVLLPTQ